MPTTICSCCGKPINLTDEQDDAGGEHFCSDRCCKSGPCEMTAAELLEYVYELEEACHVAVHGLHEAADCLRGNDLVGSACRCENTAADVLDVVRDYPIDRETEE